MNWVVMVASWVALSPLTGLDKGHKESVSTPAAYDDALFGPCPGHVCGGYGGAYPYSTFSNYAKGPLGIQDAAFQQAAWELPLTSFPLNMLSLTLSLSLSSSISNTKQ